MFRQKPEHSHSSLLIRAYQALVQAIGNKFPGRLKPSG